MALTKPILYSQAAFDATESHVFTFNVVGGDQVVANKLVIKSQETGNVVYENLEQNYKFAHTVASNSLTNGVYYTASIVTYNSQEEESVESDFIQFYCYSTPSWNFYNVPPSGIIENATYNFQVEYNQEEGELLESYDMILYDVQQIEVARSGIKYATSETLPTIVEYQFAGLNDKTVYYIRAEGITTAGTIIDTGLIRITIAYYSPNIFSIVELSNNCDGGYVIVKSNLITISGESNPSPPIYTDNNTAVDLTAQGSWVEWGAGYNLSSDFTMSLWGRNFNENSIIVEFQDRDGNDLKIGYRQNTDGKYYVDCFVTDNPINYYICSNFINEPISTDTIQVWFRRIANLYEIALYNLNENES